MTVKIIFIFSFCLDTKRNSRKNRDRLFVQQLWPTFVQSKLDIYNFLPSKKISESEITLLNFCAFVAY